MSPPLLPPTLTTTMFFYFILLLFSFSLARPVPTTTTTTPAPGIITVSPLRPLDDYNYTWSGFQRLLDAQKGSNIHGLSELKQYFHRFGYLSLNDTKNLTDTFDSRFESALIRYQSKLGLPMSGKLDSNTVSQLMVPRCGVSDAVATLHVRKTYAFFPGQPRWNRFKPMMLTYALSPSHSIDYLDGIEIQGVLQRAFKRWADVIPVSFTEADEYKSADIKIGFYKGDHGDGAPFDGVLGVLGHAFSPQSGRFHLDGDETWAIDFGREKAQNAIDLESVVTHEIGHVLGLAHSSVKEAVMYASLSPRTKKVNLKVDDVEGVQALYGSNPNFNFNSLLVSETSDGQPTGSRRPKRSEWVVAALFYLTVQCFNLIR